MVDNTGTSSAWPTGPPDDRAYVNTDARGIDRATLGLLRLHDVDDAATVEAVLSNEAHVDVAADPPAVVIGRPRPPALAETEPPDDPAVGRISRYAWGDDYHRVMKDKLYLLYHWLDERVGGISGRVFVDSAPVLDKAWAARSGLGWQGKHTNLLNRDMGSFFFIGELIVDVPLPADGPLPDYCGTCTRCIDACPTDAIYQPYAVDANRCISYLTIEDRDRDVPEALKPKLDNWIFGCDVCQDVCPWNKFKRPTHEPQYAPRQGVTDTDLREWVELDLEAFRKRFEGSPIERATYEGFVRNARANLEALQGGAAKSGSEAEFRGR